MLIIVRSSESFWWLSVLEPVVNLPKLWPRGRQRMPRLDREYLVPPVPTPMLQIWPIQQMNGLSVIVCKLIY